MSEGSEVERFRKENERLKRMLEQHGVEWRQVEFNQNGEQPLNQTSDAGPQETTAKRTASEKIALFRSLFRGRADVYPIYWQSTQGKSGYSPACGNEWQPGICHKPRVKCSECLHSRFLPVTDRVIYDHLAGKHAIGVYPLLKNDHCWFLAVDFDGTDWKEDARAFRQTCKEVEVPASIEISRSGNGAHIWIFFDEPVPARDARTLGTRIVSFTCDRLRQLALTSYDRFFPNQDSLPQGGFGNLIALPLQRDLREAGRTVFVDEDFAPYEDQWAFLSTLGRMSMVDLTKALSLVGTDRRSLDVASYEDENAATPWRNPQPQTQAIPGPLPEEIELVLADQIYVTKKSLPQPLSNRLIRLAAFENPEFHKAQAMRLPVWNKPRVIGCAENFPEHIALPRGCLDDLGELLDKNGIIATVRNERVEGKTIPVEFRGILRDDQKEAVKSMLKHETGVLCASTGFGKTVIASAMITRRKVSTLILVHRTQLMRQWEERLSSFLKLAGGAPGLIGGGKESPTGCIDVAVMQTLSRRNDLPELLSAYGQVIVDECHHISAFSFESILKQSRARYVHGLTATPYRRDGHHPIIFMQCGPLRYKAGRPEIAPRDLEVVPRFIPLPALPPEAGIQDVFRCLSTDPRRNRSIAADIVEAFKAGRKVLVLTQRTGHIQLLVDELRGRVDPCFVLHGRIPARQRRAVLDTLAELPDSTPHVILATGRLVGEGFDHPPLDTLILAMPVSWKGTLQQYAGRLHRSSPDKSDVRIYDYIEEEEPRLVRMWKKRQRGYRAMGYRIKSAETLF